MRRHTKAQVLDQFRYNWKVLTKQQPQWKGDTIAKREAWNDFVDMLSRDGDITQSQRDNWTNPF
jgi:hypothetical protein